MTRLVDRLQYFRQLRWKLTLSYTAVTVSALLAGELLLIACLVGGTLLLLRTDLIPTLMVQEIRNSAAPELRPYLEQSPPDVKGIARWLQSSPTAGSGAGSDSSLGSNSRVVVLGPDGVVLGIWPEDSTVGQTGQPFDPEAITDSAAVVESALAGEQDASRLYAQAGGRLTVAAPVMDAHNKQVLGVVLIDLKYVENMLGSFGPLFQVLGYSLGCLVVVAGGIGTLFGFVTARGLAQRLKNLTGASDAWSQGRFGVFVEDRSADEIGQLAARLNRMAQQLQNLLDARQELAVVEERNRLARDLHDSAKQQAFAASAQIAAAKAVIDQDPQAAMKHLAEAEQLVNALRKELSALIAELRPAALADRGLAAALTDYASKWSRQSRIESAMRIQSERSLPLEVEQTIFRIMQEALANVARHSGASRVDLWLGYEANAITLTVSDNGQGFEVGKNAGGFGLSSMRERAQALGGSLEVQSTPSGTSITARCPLNQTSLQRDQP